MFYINGTNFTLFLQDLILSSLSSPIRNCPDIVSYALEVSVNGVTYVFVVHFRSSDIF